MKRASLYISAAGLYETYIGNAKVGGAVLAPALSQTEKRMFYNTYDVTSLLGSTASHVLCVVAVPGRWTAMRPLQEVTGEWTTKLQPTDTLAGYKPRFPIVLYQLEVEYIDGSKVAIVSDNTWKVSVDGPIRTANEYDGERYDARMELTGWRSVGYNASAWSKAEEYAAPTPVLSAENKEPIRETEILTPKSINKIGDTYIVDMGQNMVGYVQLLVKGTAGKKVSMRFAELLKADGSLYLDNMRTAEVLDVYTLNGNPAGESWKPLFTYHGSRYVEITGYPGTLTPESIRGLVVHDDVEIIGTFASDQSTLTQLHKNAFWGIRGNYRSMPTDCPQRDERFGWLGDRALEVGGESYLFNVYNLYRKWLQDIRDAQLENGSIPDVAPTHSGGIKIYNDGVVWPSCFIIIPDQLYKATGDIRIIKENYDAMIKWAKLMQSYMSNNLIERNTYGDWCVPPEELNMIWSNDPKRITSGMFLSSCYLYYDFMLLSKYASILQDKQGTEYWYSQAQKIKSAIILPTSTTTSTNTTTTP